MITQLLQISTTPVKYELEIERARLEYNQDFIPKAKVKTQQAKMEMRSRNTQLLVDTYKARRSLGQNNSSDFYKLFSDKGAESISRATRDHVETGNSLSRIDIGVNISQIIEQKMLEQPVTYMAFIPNPGSEISWIPSEFRISVQPGELNYDWQIMRDIMNYVPGSVRMNILQQPKVHIEYMGRPMYIPPSADPEYEEAS
ncbi:MAG: DUF6470 family protein [Clostridiales bacterium]|nr:DUF6470 family protein [Clostridiales bacterium]